MSSFFHHDGLGSTRQLTNAAGTLTDAYSFDAFGNTTGQTGTTFNPSKYVGSLGYYSDSDSGLMLLQHRYYDPGAGRFITLDPIKDGVNWYAYCGNDPVNGVDPTGLYWETPLDCLGLAMDVHDFVEHPTILGGLCIIGDVGGMLLPLVPSVGVITHADDIAKAACKAAGHADEAADASKVCDGAITHEKIHRKTPGGDGGEAVTIREKCDGQTISVTHQVHVDGELVHQHQTHIGKNGTKRCFPDEWVEHPHVRK